MTIRIFSTSFTPPPTPTIVVTGQSASGRIRIAITNPAPGVGEPALAENYLYRRESGDTTWTRIETGIGASETTYDYAVASGVTYEYKVRAVGDNDVTADSNTGSDLVTLTELWIHAVANPATTILSVPYQHDPSPNESWDAQSTVLQPEGRTRPVVEFGDQESFRFQATIRLGASAQADWIALRDLIRTKATLCVRDLEGRRIFGVIPRLGKLEARWGHETAIEVVEIDYDEEV